MSEKKSWFSLLKARFSRTINEAEASFQSIVQSAATSTTSDFFESSVADDNDVELEKRYLAVEFHFSDDSSGKSLAELLQKYKSVNREAIVAVELTPNQLQNEKIPNLFVDPCPFDIEDSVINSFLQHVSLWQGSLFPRTNDSKILLFELLQHFKSIYNKWSGDELLEMDEKQLNTLDPSLQVLGHPKEFLELLSDYFTVVCFQFRLEFTKPISLDLVAFEKSEDLLVLEVLEILCRSPYNRYHLKHYGIVSKILVFFNSCLHRLENLLKLSYDDVERVSKSYYQNLVQFQRDILQLSLSIIYSFTESTPLPENLFIPQQHNKRERGAVLMKKNSVEKRIRQKGMMNCLFDYGITDVLSKVLILFQKCINQQREFDFVFDLQKKALLIARTLIDSGGHDLKKQFLSDGIQILVFFLGWPVEFQFDSWVGPYQQIAKKFNQYRLKLHFELQIMVMKIILIILKLNNNYLQKFGSAGLFKKLLESSMWVSFFFNLDEDYDNLIEALQQNSLSNIKFESSIPGLSQETINTRGSVFYSKFPKFVPFFGAQGENSEAQELTMPYFIKKLANQKYMHFFECIHSFVTLSKYINPPKGLLPSHGVPTHSELVSVFGEEESRYEEKLATLIFDIFLSKDVDQTCYMAAARKKLKLFNDFQFYAFDALLTLVSSKTSKTLDVLVSHGLYDLLFSEFFYFFGGKHNPANQQIIAQTHSDTESDDYDAVDKRIVSQLVSSILRESCISFIKYGCSIKTRDPVEECRKIIEVLGTYDYNSFIVAEIGFLLLDLMYTKYSSTLSSLKSLSGASVISFIFQTQQKMFEQKGLLGKIELEDAGDIKILEARNICLSILDVILNYDELKDSIMQDTNTVDALYLCIFDPVLKEFALSRITKILVSEVEDQHSLDAVILGFSTMVKRIVANPTEQNLHLLVELLKMLRAVLNEQNRKNIQKHFKQRLVPFADILRTPVANGLSNDTLVCEVLKTIGVLIKDNRRVQKHVKDTGFYNLLIDALKNVEMSQAFWNEMYSLMFEKEMKEEEEHYMIKNADIIPLLFELHMDCCSADKKMEFLEFFYTVVEKSINNQEACCSVGLISVLLNYVEKFDKEEQQKAETKIMHSCLSYLIDLIEILGKHSMTVKELKHFFSLIKSESENAESSLLTLLLKALKQIPQKNPSSFFFFDGKKSGLELPSFEKWPNKNSKGYTVMMWIRLENILVNEKARLFSFLNEEGHGVEVVYDSNSIYFHNATGKQPSYKTLDFQFKVGIWYHLCFVHSKSITLKGSEFKFYIDGKLQTKLSTKYLNTSNYNQCRVGTNTKNKKIPYLEKQNRFCGQIPAFYIFDDALTSLYIASIKELGPNYISTFHNSEAQLFDSSISYLFDGSMTKSIYLSYNAKAVNGKRSLNNGPEIHLSDMSAKIRKGTRFCVTYNVKDIIGCLGGIKILFPLVLQMDKLLHTTDLDVSVYDPYRVNTLLQLILDFLKDHKDNQEDMVRCRGFHVICFLLKQISPQHLTEPTINLIPEIFSAIGENDALFNDVVNFFLFDFRLWIYTDAQVQKCLVDKLIQVVENSRKSRHGNKFRKIVGVQKILDILRWFYWFKKEDQSLGTEQICHPKTNAILAERPKEQSVVEIRSLLFRLIKTLLDSPATFEEVSALVRFVTHCQHDVQQQIDVLRFLLQIMFCNGSNIVAEHFVSCGGYEAMLLLLKNLQEEVRLLALKCIGRVLILNPKYRSRVAADQIHGFSFIMTQLYHFPFDEKMYKVFRDIFLATVSPTDESIEVESEYKANEFQVVAAVPAIFRLLLNTDLHIRLSVIQDWKSQSKSEQLQSAMIRIPGWQTLLLELLATNESEASDQTEDLRPIVEEAILHILTMLLYHALICTKQGWRVLEETIAHIHNYEEKGILLSKKVLGKIYARLLDSYTIALEKKIMPNIAQEKGTPILENFLHLISYVEEFIFYSNNIAGQLHHSVSKRKTENYSDILQKSPSTRSLVPTTMITNVESPELEPQSLPEAEKPVSYSLSPDDTDGDDTKSDIGPETPMSSGSTSLQKLAALNRKSMYIDVENLNQAKEDVAIMVPIAEKLIVLIEFWKLHTVANFSAFGNLISSSKKLRVGGTLRIALRLIRYCLKESDELDALHIDCVKSIIQRDVESEKEMQKFSELWAVTGDLEEGEDFQNRLLYALGFLIETVGSFIKKGNTEAALAVLGTVKTIFTWRKQLLESRIKTDDGKMILTSSFILFKKKKLELSDYQEMQSIKNWDIVWQRHLSAAIRKMEDEEVYFTSAIVKRRRAMLARVQQHAKHVASLEKEFEKHLLVETRKVIDNLRTNETGRLTTAKSRYEEKQVVGSRLWKRIIRTVAEERGSWGTQKDESSLKWKLDKTENSRRMRLKLKRDYSGIDHTGAAHTYQEANAQHTSEAVEPSTPTQKDDEYKNKALFIRRLPRLKEGVQPKEEEIDESKLTLSEELMNYDAFEEKSLMKVSCDYLTPLQGFSGELEITTKRLIWIADKENKCEVFGLNEEVKLLIKAPKDKVVQLDQIREIHPRRYRLIRSAFEFFLTDSTSILFNFPNRDHVKVYKRILLLKPSHLESVLQLSPVENLNKSGVTKLWQKGLISNFEYLMKLNSFAGRNYNDLSQHPVFPWILTNYESEECNLNDENNYRDLSKPVGALNPDRLEIILEKYENFIDPTGNMKKFHYGSHYTSPGIILYYLVRMEPYTTYSRILQGGKFDVADRMFDSLPQTFKNCMVGPDYKELIPEFFYNPEFLELHNGLYLGKKQTGAVMGDVILPKWAKNSAETFIRIHRDALESDYVSENLHNWIDLIFGYKQQGKAAEDAHNLFRQYSYEENVGDLETCEAWERRAIIAEIENFGQTPIQLFAKAHPKRLKREEMLRAVTYNPIQFSYQFAKQITSTTSASLVYIKALNDRIYAASSMGTMYSIKYAFGTPFVFDVTQRKKLDFPFSSEVSISHHNFAIPINTSKDCLLFSTGHWDCSLRCTKPFAANSTSIQALWRHRDHVTCMTLCENERTLVTASKDTTIVIWDVDATDDRAPIHIQPKNILYGHNDEITCIAASSDLDIVISGSRDRTVIIHSLMSGKYTKTIHHVNHHVIDLIALSSDLGHILIYSSTDSILYLYSINGKLLMQCDVHEKLNCMIVHECKYVISGGDRGIVTVRNLYDLSVVCKYDVRSSNELQFVTFSNSSPNIGSANSPSSAQTSFNTLVNNNNLLISLNTQSGFAVKSIALTPDSKFMLCGLYDGKMVVFSTQNVFKK